MDIDGIVKKYNIDLKKLENEQSKLAKTLQIKDSVNFDDIERIGGCDSVFFQNKIIVAIVVVDKEGEVLEQQYFSDKLRFPYIAGFRAYRELPAIVSCFNKLEVKPEVIFINGHGIAHPRLGLASHFSIATGIPSIGVADDLMEGVEVKGESLVLNGKDVGKTLLTKEGSKPIYISPGNLISLNSAIKLTKMFVKAPHKLPQPIVLAHKYGKKVRSEVFQD